MPISAGSTCPSDSNDADSAEVLALQQSGISDFDIEDLSFGNGCVQLSLLSAKGGPNLNPWEDDLTGVWGVWDATRLLCEYLCVSAGDTLQTKRCLELGCGGAAAAGIVAASLGASEVVLTDRNHTALSLAATNASKNLEGFQRSRVSVELLEWTCPEKFNCKGDGFDLLFGGDLLYYATQPQVLLRAAAVLGSKDSLLILSCIEREEGLLNQLVFTDAPAQGWEGVEVDLLAIWPNGAPYAGKLLVFTRSEQSRPVVQSCLLQDFLPSLTPTES